MRKLIKVLATGGNDNARLSLWENEKKKIIDKEPHPYKVFEIQYSNNALNGFPYIRECPNKKDALDYAEAEIFVHQMIKC
jgi:hypothetical protein